MPSQGHSDRDLVRDAVAGSREALDRLLRRHETAIYGLAVRMLWEPRDAEDATQEILLKIATRLSSFRGECAFRTWAYRIAANHLVSVKRSRVEETISGFDCYGRALAAVPTEDIADDAAPSPEDAALAHEVKVGCTIGMLLCLERDQRIVFVLGEVLELPDAVGAEVIGTSRDNFRQRLARARDQLRSFLAGNCGLADRRNGCRCARKTKGFIRAGLVDPNSLRFATAHRAAVEDGAVVERSGRVLLVAVRGVRRVDYVRLAAFAEVNRRELASVSPDEGSGASWASSRVASRLSRFGLMRRSPSITTSCRCCRRCPAYRAVGSDAGDRARRSRSAERRPRRDLVARCGGPAKPRGASSRAKEAPVLTSAW